MEWLPGSPSRIAGTDEWRCSIYVGGEGFKEEVVVKANSFEEARSLIEAKVSEVVK